MTATGADDSGTDLHGGRKKKKGPAIRALVGIFDKNGFAIPGSVLMGAAADRACGVSRRDLGEFGGYRPHRAARVLIRAPGPKNKPAHPEEETLKGHLCPSRRGGGRK